MLELLEVSIQELMLRRESYGTAELLVRLSHPIVCYHEVRTMDGHNGLIEYFEMKLPFY